MEEIIDKLVKSSTEERNLQSANEDSTPKKRKRLEIGRLPGNVEDSPDKRQKLTPRRYEA